MAGIEPAYSAWEASRTLNIFNGALHSPFRPVAIPIATVQRAEGSTMKRTRRGDMITLAMIGILACTTIISIAGHILHLLGVIQ